MTVKSPRNADFVAPAFPVSLDVTAPGAQGLSKREYFAAAALTGALANEHLCDLDSRDVVLYALEHSDWMLQCLQMSVPPKAT